MPHITFIHGICNKPPKEKLLDDWEFYLEQCGLNVGSITTSMVYWADVLYEKPLPPNTDFESVAKGLETSQTNEEMAWIDDLPDTERAFVDTFRKKLRFDQVSPQGDDYEPPPFQGNEDKLEQLVFEAIPLPWFIKRRIMKALLKDVHHYLFNAKFSPRAGEEYQVQDHIRSLFVKQLQRDKEGKDFSSPHIVVSHSMGTVISYDCLKNVPDCPAVDAYMTVGCPLGISEVYDNFKPAYNKHNAFPTTKVKGDWVNVYDRLDPVALDARIANDYQKDGKKVIIDQRVHNSGRWRHSSSKYFRQQALCEHLERMLAL